MAAVAQAHGARDSEWVSSIVTFATSLPKIKNVTFEDRSFLGGIAVDISVYGVYCAIMTSKELIALLNQDGWTLRGSKGSHHVFIHPSKAGHLTVPHPKKDLGTGLVKKILKQAGLK